MVEFAISHWHQLTTDNKNDISAIVGGIMAAITIRNFDDFLKNRLRMRAISRNRSMEAEARAILREALQEDEHGLGSLIHRRFLEAGGIELPPPDRSQPNRKPSIST